MAAIDGFPQVDAIVTPSTGTLVRRRSAAADVGGPAQGQVMGEHEKDNELWFTAGDYLRKVRRVADLSQRQAAEAAKRPRSAVERIEAGRIDPRIGQLQQALDLVSWSLVVVILDPERGEWWGDQFGLARPPETYTRSRAKRDEQRARSQRGLYRGEFRRGWRW